MLCTIDFPVAAQDIRHFQLWAIHSTAAQKCWGAAGFSMGTGTGSRSSGLVAAHTLTVAIRRYRAVVAMLRWPSSNWIVHTSTPDSSK